MENKGQITVFLSLVLASLLVLFLTAAGVTGYYMDKAWTAEAAEGAMHHVKADYQAQIFEEYHLLLLDKDYIGQGEGAIEESVSRYLEYTLSSQGFTSFDVCLTGTESVLAEDCAALKDQIGEYMTLYLQKKGAETVYQALLDGEQAAKDVKETVEAGKEEESEQESSWNGEDPRDQLKTTMNAGLLNVVLPAGTAVSRSSFDREALPSVTYGNKKTAQKESAIDFSFSDVDRLESDLDSQICATDSAAAKYMKGALYALDCFQSFTANDKTDHVLDCEVEYLIAGKDNDYDNLASVVNRILLCRFPVNMVVLLSDPVKMAEIDSMALTISLAPGITYGAAKYLLAACLSYGETLLEIRTLLSGGKIPLVKKMSDWMLDFDSMGKLTELETTSYDGVGGVSYETFLLLFLLEQQNDMYYRMCDLIQLNISSEQPDFRMENCIHAFSADIRLEKGDTEFGLSVGTSY